jgi:hypothetical protein
MKNNFLIFIMFVIFIKTYVNLITKRFKLEIFLQQTAQYCTKNKIL